MSAGRPVPNSARRPSGNDPRRHRPGTLEPLPDVASAHRQILFHARRERVAERRRKWQGSHMSKPSQSLAGGVFIAIAIFIGAIAGAISGQPSIGVLAGLAAGVLCAVFVWLRDRSRTGR
jgi:hypothetical protein